MDFLKKFISPGNKTPTAPLPAAPVSKKVLIVEDDQYLRDFYVELLKGAAYDVLSADNGQSGFDMIIAQKPDLVLLDLNMPVMDGKSMLHKLRAMPEFKQLKVIVLTNSGSVDNMTQTRFYDGASDFLVKSNVKPEEVLSKVKTYLG